MKSVRLIDLYCGAGGLTVGFTWLSQHPYKPVWANDFNQYAAETYNKNFGPHCKVGDITEILSNGTEIPSADVVIGGPPCQGFSLLNKKRADDPRKELWFPFMEVVKRSGARAFVMENVPQLIGSSEHAEILEYAEREGFACWSGVLLAADYGVPQLRKRAVIVGYKDAHPADFFPPPKTNYSPRIEPNRLEKEFSFYTENALPWRTVRDAIGDLPKPVGTEIREEEPPLNLHFGRSPTPLSKARYRAIPKEGMNRFDLERIAPDLTPECWKRKRQGGTDLFGRMWWDRPSFTIRTEFFKPEKGRYLHPSSHRPITHREAARIQTFPDHFEFVGSKIEIARQIGNAVPPLLAAKVADRLYEMLTSTINSTRDGRFSAVETAPDNVSGEEQRHRRRASREVVAS